MPNSEAAPLSWLRPLAFKEVFMSTFKSIPEELMHMIPGFLERRLVDAKELDTFLKHKSFHECKNLGHRLKGCGTSFGFPEISELGGKIQEAAEIEDFNLLSEAVQEYQIYIVQTINNFKAKSA